MASTNFKLFDENKQNMMPDQEYSTNQARLGGVQAGLASSALHNKSMYQQSLMANAIAQFMVAKGFNANDSDAVSTFNNNLVQALNTLIQETSQPLVNDAKAEARQVNINVTSSTTDGTVLFSVPREPRFILSTCFGSSVGPEFVMGLLWPFRTQFIKQGGLSYFTFEKQGLNFVYKKVSNERLPLDCTVDMIIFY